MSKTKGLGEGWSAGETWKGLGEDLKELVTEGLMVNEVFCKAEIWRVFM